MPRIPGEHWTKSSEELTLLPEAIHPRSLALATDLYELTMAAGYFVNEVRARATFEMFVRDLPERRNYLLCAGLDPVLSYLESLRFTGEDIDYLRGLRVFEGVSPAFYEYLRAFRFTGEVWALAEGTPAFQTEPLLQVTAPIIEAQVVETFVLATINFQTLIASKAARIVAAAQGRTIVEFGSRRAHGTEAALYAARAAYIGGCDGTSNVEAGLRFGIPVFGTIAHSWVMTFTDEVESFRRYMRAFPRNATLLIDTYDTVAAAEKIVRAGLRPQSVRLDSGSLEQLSHAVRRILDAGGLGETQIFASGDLDEERIAALVTAGAPIDAFGVGTRLSTSFDEPALGGVYKLVALQVDHEVHGKIKTSPGKSTLPGRKQVWRRTRAGESAGDTISGAEEAAPLDAESLLACVMRDGHRLDQPPAMSALQARARAAIDRLPAAVRGLGKCTPYPVTVSDRLRAEQRKLAAAVVEG